MTNSSRLPTLAETTRALIEQAAKSNEGFEIEYDVAGYHPSLANAQLSDGQRVLVVLTVQVLLADEPNE